MRWLTVRHGRKKRRKDFLKLHFIVDCRSLLILSFKVTPPFKADSRQVEELLKFIGSLGRLCADKAYLSRKICDLIAKHGGVPYISIKRNVVKIRAQGSKAWRQMLVMYRRSRILQEAVPPEELGRDRGIHRQEEVQPHPLLDEEEGAEE